jgi:hypothetical protein
MNRKKKLKQVRRQVKLTTMTDREWLQRFQAVDQFHELVKNYYKSMA